MAEFDINELRSAAKQGKTAFKFWEKAFEILEAIPVAENMVYEAQQRRKALEAELAAVQEKVKKATEAAQAKMSEVDTEVRQRIDKAKAAAQATIAASQSAVAEWQGKVAAEQAKYDALIKATQEAGKQAAAQAKSLLDSARAKAAELMAKAEADVKEIQTQALAAKNQFEAEKAAKGITLSKMDEDIAAAKSRLDSLNSAYEATRQKLAALLG